MLSAARYATSALLFGGIAMVQSAGAASQSATFNHLTESATFSTPFLNNDTLLLDTLVTTEVGALSQTLTFTVGAGVTGLTGGAVWEITTAAGPGPRLIGVNIDIFDSSNALIASDTGAGTAAGFALSTFAGAIAPGTYRLVASGTGVRDSSLDVSLSFVPEPETYALMLAGLGVVGFYATRRRRG